MAMFPGMGSGGVMGGQQDAGITDQQQKMVKVVRPTFVCIYDHSILTNQTDASRYGVMFSKVRHCCWWWIRARRRIWTVHVVRMYNIVPSLERH